MTTEAICTAAVSVAKSLDAKAILTCTESGHTAINIARNRPSTQIVAITPHDSTIRRMQLFGG